MRKTTQVGGDRGECPFYVMLACEIIAAELWILNLNMFILQLGNTQGIVLE